METDNLAKDTTCAPPNDTLREPVDTGGPFKGKYSTASKMSQPGQDLEVPPPAKTLRVSLSWNPRLLELALACFPATNLRLWFEWIVRDVVQNRASFPDLVQFRPSERRYRMVEIKGPGDRLQEPTTVLEVLYGASDAGVCVLGEMCGGGHSPEIVARRRPEASDARKT
jgi:hypothetical protein